MIIDNKISTPVIDDSSKRFSYAQSISYNFKANGGKDVKKIFFIRHGESEGNVDKKKYIEKTDFEIKLTDKGIHQATITGEYLNDFFSSINSLTSSRQSSIFFSSPFVRARMTADIICSKINGRFDLVENPLLVEQSVGTFVGHSTDQFKNFEGYGGDLYRKYAEPMKNESPNCNEINFFAPFPMGESLAQAYLRAEIFHMRNILMSNTINNYNNIFIVSHGAFQKCLIGAFLNDYKYTTSWGNHFPKNASCLGFEFSDKKIGDTIMNFHPFVI